MPRLLTRVKSRLFIHAAQKSLHALDGAYASLMRGRSFDFEDLRPYEYGDQVRDIEWKATARHGQPLIKRMRALRRHTVLLIVDSGRGMNALAEDEGTKRDLSVLIAGALGFLAVRHGDEVSFFLGDAANTSHLPPVASEDGLERGLRALDTAIRQSSAPNDRDALLARVARTVSRRRIIVIITDEAPLTEQTEGLLRRLRAQHDVLWMTLRDADPAGEARHDVDSGWRVPSFVSNDPDVHRELAAQELAETTRREETLRRLEIDHTEFDGRSSAVTALLRLLHRRSHARP